MAIHYDASGPTLVISPHLDDALLSCWSVLTSPKVVEVATVCAGLPEPGVLTPLDKNRGARESRAWVESRIKEDREVLTQVGRKPTNLHFLDIQYRAHGLPALREAIEKDPDNFVELVARANLAPLPPTEIIAAIEKHFPAAAEIFLPAGTGGHPDHRDVSSLANLTTKQGIKTYTYADIPYALKGTWPLPGQVHHLSATETARKIQVLQGYQTQFAGLNDAFGGKLTDPALMQYEVFWEVDLT